MDFDVTYDLIVVGGGGAGKSAAYVAAKAGKSVVLLEKDEQTGGTSMYAEGHAAVDSPVQKRLGTPPRPGFGGSEYGDDSEEAAAKRHFPTKEEAYKKYEHYSHGRCDNDVVKSFVDHSAEMIEMFEELGINYLTCTIPGDDPNEIITGHIPEGASARCQEVLLDAIEKLGVDIFCNTPAKELVTDETGRVIGVIAESDGAPLRVGGKAVILATGGMQCSNEMMAKHSWLGKNALNITQLTPCKSVGDGLKMALAVGADPSDTTTAPLCFFGARGKAADSESGAAGMQPGAIWVNQGGRRFANEGIIWESHLGNTIARQPGAITYTVMDSDFFEKLVEQGSEIPLGAFVVIGKPLEHLRMEVEQSIADGLAFKADTIEELAQAAGMNPDTLAQTVERYNADCEAGKDSQYLKDPQYLNPIKKGPFYAIEMGIGLMGSGGGIRINGNMQVVNENREPIEGLYATGLDATGLYGDTYNMEAGGSHNGFAHTSGRIAAQHFLDTLA